MGLQTTDGAVVNVDEANRAFDRAMAAPVDDNEPTAPAPPKRDKAAEPKPAPRKRTAKAKEAKTLPSPATPAITTKRAQAGADILHTMAVVTESMHVATGDVAWHKDTELFAAQAEQFGQAMADVAAHNAGFARFLDSEGSGSAMAYLGLALVTAQISTAVVDNHNARGKVPLFVQSIGLKVKKFLGSTKKRSNAPRVSKS